MSLIGVRAKNHPQQTIQHGANDKINTRITPDAVWQKANKEFGPFTLDVAASAENSKCENYFTLELNGLLQPWYGRVWCNPPYSNVAEWVAKAHTEIELLHCKSIVMLVPSNRTEQRWWQIYIEPFRDRGIDPFSIRKGRLKTQFLPGRLEFGPPAKDGKGNRPPFGCVLLVWQ